MKIDKTLKDSVECNPQLHTAYCSVLGQLNWLQSRTHVHLCYKFSRCASAASSATIGDVREINKVVRTLKSQYVDGRFWPLKGPPRILGMPDASYRCPMHLTEIIATSLANVHMSFFLLKIANCHQRTHTDNTVMVLRPQMIPQHVVPLSTMKATR